MKSDINTIFFDIDGTLVEEISWKVLTDKLGADFNMVIKYLYQLRKNEIDIQTANDLVTKCWVETGNATRKNVQRIFDEIEVRAEAFEVIATLQSKYKVVVISGSMDLYVETISKKLGVSDWFSNTKLLWDNNGDLSGIDYKVDQAGLKLNQVKNFASLHNHTLDQYAIIGDGDSDEQLLKELGMPILYPNSNTPKEILDSVKIKINNLFDLLKMLDKSS